MSLEIHQHDREGITVLDLKGRLTFGEEDLAFRENLQRLINAGKHKLILSMEHLTDVDTAGIGSITYASATLKAAGGRLVLLNLRPSHMELFVLFKLEVDFDVFDNELDAVNSFFPDRKATRVDLFQLISTFKKESRAEKGSKET